MGERKEGGVKGKERRGKGGGRAAITLNCQVWLQHIKYNHVYRVGYGTLRDAGIYTTYTPPLCHLELLFPPDKCLTWPTLCWVFKDNYKAMSNTSPPNIWKEQVREDGGRERSEQHTSELQSPHHLLCR